MNNAYAQKIVKRIRSAWPDDGYCPIKVEEHDGHAWLVTFVQEETGECVTVPLAKRKLREQEHAQAFRLLSHLAFPASTHPGAETALSDKECTAIHQLVRSATAELVNSPVKVLAAFLDTLVLNVYPTDEQSQRVKRKVDDTLQAELTVLKAHAQDQEEDIPTRFFFAGVPLVMTRKGADGYQWILRSSKMALSINCGSTMANLCKVRLSSEYLWSVRDVGKVVYQVRCFLAEHFGQYIDLQVSACDLAADVLNLDLTDVQEVKRHFVSRAQYKDQDPLSEQAWLDGPSRVKSRWDRLTGLPFGSRNGAVSALIYDKTHEIKYQSPEKKWFHDLWRQAKDEQGNPVWDGKAAVWRVEMRFKREALNEMKQEGVFHGIENAYDLEERLPGLWSYAVGHRGGGVDGLPDGWLRYIVPTEDTNRSRWPVHPDWLIIQEAFPSLREEEQPEEEPQETAVAVCNPPACQEETPAIPLLPFIRKRKREVNMDRIIDQIAGCIVTVEAWRPPRPGCTPELRRTVSYVYQRVETRMEEKQRDFSASVRDKRDLYSIELDPDNAAADVA